MVQIILNGCCGRMGTVLSEQVKIFENLSIVAGIDRVQLQRNYPIFLSLKQCTASADVIIDFSSAAGLSDLLAYGKEKNIALILCSTGYTEEQLKQIEMYSKEIPIFHSANMSLGINVLNSMLKQISNFLYKNFDIEVIEKHHNQKIDAPSGTALLLANTIKNSITEETEFSNGREGMKKRTRQEIGIHAVRGGNIVGDHEIIFAGQGEVIELKHSAISRDVFAVGALKASEFMFQKNPGLYSMDDLITPLMKNSK